MAEEQPVAARRLGRHALVQEGAERRDAGAGADHDDRHRGIGRQAEGVRLLHIDFELCAGLDAARRGTSRRRRGACALADLVAHGIDGERDAAGIDLRRGRDRIEPRLQRIERLDEGFRIGADAGEFLDRGEHVEGGGIAVRVLAGRQRLRLLPPLAAGDVGEKLEQHVGRGRERHAVDQHLAQRAPADREIRPARRAPSMTASTSAGSLVGKRPKASPTV